MLCVDQPTLLFFSSPRRPVPFTSRPLSELPRFFLFSILPCSRISFVVSLYPYVLLSYSNTTELLLCSPSTILTAHCSLLTAYTRTSFHTGSLAVPGLLILFGKTAKQQNATRRNSKNTKKYVVARHPDLLLSEMGKFGSNLQRCNNCGMAKFKIGGKRSAKKEERAREKSKPEAARRQLLYFLFAVEFFSRYCSIPKFK